MFVVGGENILFCLAHFLLVTGIFFVVALYIYEHELSVLAPRLVWGKDVIVEEWLSGSLYDLQGILFCLYSNAFKEFELLVYPKYFHQKKNHEPHSNCKNFWLEMKWGPFHLFIFHLFEAHILNKWILILQYYSSFDIFLLEVISGYANQPDTSCAFSGKR